MDVCIKDMRILFLLLICLSIIKLHSAKSDTVYVISTDSIELIKKIHNVSNNQNKSFSEFSNKRPNPLVLLFKKKQAKNKKAVAAALAFPFPFGMVGLHRIYLGTAPYVPVVYIGTVGGGFGILPFIDFCVILLDKDITRYHENKKIFMWVNE